MTFQVNSTDVSASLQNRTIPLKDDFNITFHLFTGGMNGNLSVVCGSQLAAETTTMKISTTTAFSTIQLSNPSSVVLTTISSSTINIKNANITTTTPTILSEERICGNYFDFTCKLI